ncbi:MAG: hypothetical protein NC393_05405 [Clostridium sp.]|nr:hypothetical protein [Clostridium sp.]MCM1171550.1 hypothetical protein [Clostridium sp.]
MSHNENPDNLYLFMSEEDAPFEEGKNPFPRTKEDDEFDDYIIKKYHLDADVKEMDTENIRVSAN